MRRNDRQNRQNREQLRVSPTIASSRWTRMPFLALTFESFAFHLDVEWN